MDQQLLNTGEQKDMAEFFIDLVSKLEEMTPELKTLVKTLFGGIISNNVVSLVSIIVLFNVFSILSLNLDLKLKLNQFSININFYVTYILNSERN